MKKIVKHNIVPKWAERQPLAMVKNSNIVDLGQDEKGQIALWTSHREIDEDEQAERKFFLQQDGRPFEPETMQLGSFMFVSGDGTKVHMNLIEDISEQ